jgi:hypothetical protein
MIACDQDALRRAKLLFQALCSTTVVFGESEDPNEPNEFVHHEAWAAAGSVGYAMHSIYNVLVLHGIRAESEGMCEETERAARVCEKRAEQYRSDGFEREADCAQQCADAIRRRV